ncbi:metal/formaldehyde-sensitive transcriptional repressor [Roseateles depolymerans]|uniref:Transcriptional repressor RcnR n=1 Tax=Roseateles depolymerans TaxID=76731 RepID=A0A0U3LB49_9BURK|nr:metal/formaldehyde-sensitive transcriptional repressor [Roseateles depolymerans]ALV05279.1 Transcriptional repressor RcnR [Roseateles depolymerans]REG14705.1 DNA-binding FrmR family transcriptional regulator [Roseateles depolymerans]
MAHTITGKKKLLGRIRRIQGQASALERAVDGETDCLDVLQQIAAIRGAVNGLMAEVMEGHLREHLGSPQLDEHTRQAETETLTKVIRAYLR